MLLGHCFQAQITAQSIAPWRLLCCTLWSWVEGAAAKGVHNLRTYNLVNIWPIHIQMLQWNMRDMDRLKLKMFFGIWNLRHIIHPAIALMAKWSVIIATWNILVIGHGRFLQMFLPKNPCKTEVLWFHHCFVDGSQPKMATFWARWMTCSDANRGSFRCWAKLIELLMLDT